MSIIKQSKVAFLSLWALSLTLYGSSAAQAADGNEPNDKEMPKQNCHVKCNDPHAACEESQKVIDTLHQITRCLSNGEFKALSENMDEHVTTFDEATKKLICGREAVIAEMKSRYEKSLALSQGGTVSYTIDSPYAKVNGKYATVTFKVLKNIVGKTNLSYESRSTDVFIKEDGVWKMLHYVGTWKKINS
ncbi:MAG: nuclear transport factor 2 family protein [Candidatus Obscuribacter sp.]|nr:nuclear transport factor 2 family protein [Candidatus Obscuribacter sp.]